MALDLGYIVIIYIVCELNSIIIMQLFKCVVDWILKSLPEIRLIACLAMNLAEK